MALRGYFFQTSMFEMHTYDVNDVRNALMLLASE